MSARFSAWRTEEERFASAEYAIESMMPGDGRWLIPFALLVSLAEDLHKAREAGLWLDHPAEMEGVFTQVRVMADRKAPGGLRSAHWLWKEYASPEILSLCHMVRDASGGAVNPGRGTVLRMAKNFPRMGLSNYGGALGRLRKKEEAA